VPDRVEAIAKLRRLRFTAAEIAETLGMALSTVSGILTRIGMGRLGRLGLEQPVRYERSRPGELVHVDVKKLGRVRRVGHRISGSRASQGKTRSEGRRRGIAGWEYVHIAVDDYSRLAYAEVLPDEKATTAAGFLRRAVDFYRRHGISVDAVLSDNGSAYRSTVHALACRALGIRHLRTRPYRPQTNGKAERFIRTEPDRVSRGLLFPRFRKVRFLESGDLDDDLGGRSWHGRGIRRSSVGERLIWSRRARRSPRWRGCWRSVTSRSTAGGGRS